MRIEVTQDCIDKGKPWEGFSCPVALAIQPHLPTGYKVGVGWTDMDIVEEKPNTVRITRQLPKVVSAFVKSFDKGRPVKPITFDIDLPILWL